MKRICSLLLILVLLGTLPALAFVDQSKDFYVADYAGVLSNTTKDKIINYNGALEQQCDGAQIVVVTINYLTDGLNSEEYALKLFNDWGVGSAEYNNGMLLLLVAKEYKGWLCLGYGLSGLISSREVDDLMNDHFWGYVDTDKFDKGVDELFTELMAWYDEQYDSSVSQSGSQDSGGVIGSTAGNYPYDPYDPYYPGTPAGRSSDFSLIFYILLFLIAGLWIGISGGLRYRRRSSILPFLFLGANRYSRRGRPPYNHHNDSFNNHNDHWNHHGGGGFGGGGGFSGGGHGFGGGGFGGGHGFGGGGFSGGGGGGRR